MTVIKLSKGRYKLKDRETYIEKVDRGWQVTNGTWGDVNYWLETYNTKREAIQALKSQVEKIV